MFKCCAFFLLLVAYLTLAYFGLGRYKAGLFKPWLVGQIWPKELCNSAFRSPHDLTLPLLPHPQFSKPYVAGLAQTNMALHRGIGSYFCMAGSSQGLMQPHGSGPLMGLCSCFGLRLGQHCALDWVCRLDPAHGQTWYCFNPRAEKTGQCCTIVFQRN